MAESVLGTFAQKIAGVDFAAFPDATVHKAKLHILDTFGVALAGSASPETQMVLAGLGLKGTAGTTPIWGTPYSADGRSAALANGVSAHALELDDSGGCDHSGAVVVPAVVSALSQVPQPVSGKDFLKSVLVGYEVGRRVLEAAGGYEVHNGLGWHSTGTCGVFGAAAAVGALNGFDADRMVSALGSACSFASGTWAFIHDGSPAKKLHAGRAAEGGIMAASLAQTGFAGPHSIFDGNSWGGFFQTFSNGKGDGARLVAGFGDDWRMNRCSIKPHATCRGTHSAIDAVDLLLRQNDLQAEDVAAVEADMSGFQFGMCGGKEIASKAQAQMCLPYAVAARLHYGQVSLAELAEPAWSAAVITQWLDRVSVRIDPRMKDEDEPAVTLVAKDGRRMSTVVEFPLGSPRNPLSDAQLVGKYAGLAGMVLLSDKVERLRDLILSLERRDDVRELLSLLPANGEKAPR